MKRSQIPPHMIRHVRQSGVHGDCGIACLATLLGLTYEEVLIQTAKVRPNVLKQGLHWTDFVKVGKKIGVSLAVVHLSLEDLEDATGVLGLKRMNPDHNAKAMTEEHVVYLWAGRVIDGDGAHWLDLDDYLKHYNYEMTGLLTVGG